MAHVLSIGDRAPDFTLPATHNGELTLSSLRGQIIVLFFYPRNHSVGCTSQAKAFSELKPHFESHGSSVFGLSTASLESHHDFIDKHDLAVDLISDETTATLDAYGVWVDKRMYGRIYKGIERTTFLIGRDGHIRHIWRKVRVSGHAPAVLEKVREMA